MTFLLPVFNLAQLGIDYNMQHFYFFQTQDFHNDTVYRWLELKDASNLEPIDNLQCEMDDFRQKRYGILIED